MFKRVLRCWVLPAFTILGIASSAHATSITISGNLSNASNGHAFSWYNYDPVTQQGSPNPKAGIITVPGSKFTIVMDQDTGQVQSFNGNIHAAYMFEEVNNGANVWVPSGAAIDINSLDFSYTNPNVIAERDKGFRIVGAAGSSASWWSGNVQAYGVPFGQANAVHPAAAAANGSFLNFTLSGLLADYEHLVGKSIALNSWFRYGGTGKIDIHALGVITSISGLREGPVTPPGTPDGPGGSSSSVPEPGSMALLAMGIFGGMTRKKTLA